MMHRAVFGCALALGVLIGSILPAASACNGPGCADGKPLNVLQFMREQAASTRAVKPRHDSAHAKSKVLLRPPRAVAARPKPGPLPAEAAASFASRPDPQIQQNVEVVASDQANAIGRTADTAPAETTGAAVAIGPNVQLVDAAEFNEIDRRADGGPPFATDTGRSADNQTRNEQAGSSWLGWLWSALANTLSALATAVRQLAHL